MKKINFILIVVFAIVLFSCGNENKSETKNENNNDSTNIESKEPENNLVTMSFLELNNQLRDNFKNFANEYDDKFLILSDLLVYSCKENGDKQIIKGYPYDIKEKKIYANHKAKITVTFNGEIIEIEKDGNKYFCPGIYDNIFSIYLIDKNQIKGTNLDDKAKGYYEIEENDFQELIKVKAKLKIDDKCNIWFDEAEIIK